MWKEISYKEIEGIRLGNATDDVAKTGVTVVIFEGRAIGGVDISGGGPASREVSLLDPITAEGSINALVLSGGSAFGLAASDGVVKYLEEKDMGYQTFFAKVPLVGQSCIYVLSYGSSKIRPDAKMGYQACVNSEKEDFCGGNKGAGVGATVGKICGMPQAMNSGLGVYAVKVGAIKMLAIVAVNALGDIYNYKTGEKIAGLLDIERKEFINTCDELDKIESKKDLLNSNTTIGVVITNAKFNKAEMNKIASMARSGYSRSINPVGTMADGDSLYAFSVGEVEADINMVGTMAANVMSEAIIRAIEDSKVSDEEYLSNIK